MEETDGAAAAVADKDVAIHNEVSAAMRNVTDLRERNGRVGRIIGDVLVTRLISECINCPYVS
ncbi:hypothetical protein [Williamsia sp.]|uniref:hypothetical protein n=1 Tax=Williamsia sp. TaxID=1872085 RepID=UPI0025D9BED0|nr:hypothetical protein [Williamsia sp.]